jgi:hypothetical protein
MEHRMSERTIAMLALVIAVIAIIGLALHVVIPTPPAHQPNRVWNAWQRRMPMQGQSTDTQSTAADGSTVAS